MLDALALAVVLLATAVPISREARLWLAEIRRWKCRRTRKRG
jgi:hypothetical protein